MIRHAGAASRAVGALAITVIEPPFEAALVTRSGGPPASGIALAATLGVAVGVPPVTRPADDERPATAPATAHPKRRLHVPADRGTVVAPGLPRRPTPYSARRTRLHVPDTEGPETLDLRALNLLGSFRRAANLPHVAALFEPAGVTIRFRHFFVSVDTPTLMRQS